MGPSRPLDFPLAASGNVVSSANTQEPSLYLCDRAIRRRRAFKGKARSVAVAHRFVAPAAGSPLEEPTSVELASSGDGTGTLAYCTYESDTNVRNVSQAIIGRPTSRPLDQRPQRDMPLCPHRGKSSSGCVPLEELFPALLSEDAATVAAFCDLIGHSQRVNDRGNGANR